MGHPLVWPGAPYRRHKRGASLCGSLWPIPTASARSSSTTSWSCERPLTWMLLFRRESKIRSRCVPSSVISFAVAVSLHLPGEWLPADIGVGMSTPDALSVVAPEALNRKVSHCQMNNGCPVAPLATLQVDAQLGLISVDDVEASFVRCLVAFNDEQLPDDEAL